MPFFILSCARSGSTSLAKILDKAKNGKCAIEPTPNLNRETRLAMEGRLDDPLAAIAPVIKRVKDHSRTGFIYGEKNVTYAPFIHLLYKELDPLFIFIKRDGRDVVRSLIDWHEKAFGTIYRECKTPGNLTPKHTRTQQASPSTSILQTIPAQDPKQERPSTMNG